MSPISHSCCDKTCAFYPISEIFQTAVITDLQSIFYEKSAPAVCTKELTFHSAEIVGAGYIAEPGSVDNLIICKHRRRLSRTKLTTFFVFATNAVEHLGTLSLKLRMLLHFFLCTFLVPLLQFMTIFLSIPCMYICELIVKVSYQLHVEANVNRKHS